MTRAGEAPHYLVERIRDRVAEQAHELGIHVEVCGDVVYLRGGVVSEERRREVEEAARAAAGGCTIRNEVSVIPAAVPDGEERLT
ncbi:BON domain-containing protein [Thermomonospora echinospora]|uniref:BON domain-containing protein n=1 Tax=Thermomonospora echinospora TaxID=1992 RepID=A0A1H6D348_9ACTN|nr:BON domain-containing protein [Thermomonospora echinospora]SEG79076.1 BON domain-containing protein [Thermomonospora echinospora]